jgi:DNA-binding transcriptional regulator PaaX
MLSITPHTLGEWRKAGIIQGSKIGRKVYYKLSNIVDLINRNTLINK